MYFIEEGFKSEDKVAPGLGRVNTTGKEKNTM